MPAKVTPRDVEEAPMLDSNLLTSGEHKIPDTSDLDDETPLLDADLLTSGEFKIPTEAELQAAAAAREALKPPVGVIHVPLPTADSAPPQPDDYSGVPTVIEAEDEDDGGSDLGGSTNLELPSRRISQPMKREESVPIQMIGSHGRDRAEASGELRPPSTGRAGTEPGVTQRELVTIMPRRKTGEVPGLRAEDVAARQEEKQAGANGAKVESKGDAIEAPANVAAAKTESKPEAAADTKSEAKPEAAADAKDKDKDKDKDTDKAKPASKAKPAVEPPSTPARRVSVEGGVVAPSRGPGRAAQVLIALASLLAGATVFTVCRKDKPSQPVGSTQYEDASTIVHATPDATEYAGFGADAAVAMVPPDAGKVVQVRPDAGTVAVAPPDAAQVVQLRPDAATVAVATADAGIDKNKEAKVLFDKAHLALEDGDAEQALDLLDQSLKLRRLSKTLLERARALQRLRRIDEAVASIDDAIKMNENYAPAWEQKGMLLWSEKRYTEARPALEMYLQLDPEGKRAETIRSMLDEPR
jgi:tetratricopeptide (TPR) repeat protein